MGRYCVFARAVCTEWTRLSPGGSTNMPCTPVGRDSEFMQVQHMELSRLGAPPEMLPSTAAEEAAT